MTVSKQDGVPVRRRHGQHEIGEIADVVGLEPVQLPGSVAYVDPATPWRPPSLVVVDAGAAAEVLDELWGPHCVDLVRAEADGQLEVSDAGPRFQDLAALGTARWLERWQPYPLDAGLLRLDVLSSHAHCQDLLDPEDEPPSEYDADRVRALVDQIEERLASSPPTGRWTNVVVPDWVDVLGRPAAVAASGPARALPELAGRVSADWDRVPARSISRAESAVHWSVEEERDPGRAALHVVAIAAAVPSPFPSLGLFTPSNVPSLRFRLYVMDWPLPLAEGVLAPVGQAGAWEGSAHLAPDVLTRIDSVGPQQVLVDVAVPGLPVPPRTGRAALRARARRWGTRCVASGRLAADAQAQETSARQIAWHQTLTAQGRSSGRQAVALWQSLDDGSAAETLQTWSEGYTGPQVPLGLAEQHALLDGTDA